MQKTIKSFLILFILVGFIYFIVFDSVESASENLSLYDAFILTTELTIDTKEDISRKEDILSELGDKIYEFYKIDIQKSIYDVLSSNKEKNKLQVRTVDMGHSLAYGYEFIFLNQNGKECTINFTVLNRSLIGMRGAQIIDIAYKGERVSSVPILNIAYFVYGIRGEAYSTLEFVYYKFMPNYR